MALSELQRQDAPEQSAAAPRYHPESLYFSPKVMHRNLHQFLGLAEAANRISQQTALKLADQLDELFPVVDDNRDLFIKAMVK